MFFRENSERICCLWTRRKDLNDILISVGELQNIFYLDNDKHGEAEKRIVLSKHINFDGIHYNKSGSSLIRNDEAETLNNICWCHLGYTSSADANDWENGFASSSSAIGISGNNLFPTILPTSNQEVLLGYQDGVNLRKCKLLLFPDYRSDHEVHGLSKSDILKQINFALD